jgi:hypothetical protein
MTTLEAVRAELLADLTLQGLVGQRIYPLVMPQGSETPALVLTVISDIPENSFDGTAETRLREARVQIDSYAETYLQAHQLADAVLAIVGNLSRPDLSAVADDSRDLYDDETELHRVSADFAVFR